MFAYQVYCVFFCIKIIANLKFIFAVCATYWDGITMGLFNFSLVIFRLIVFQYKISTNSYSV